MKHGICRGLDTLGINPLPKLPFLFNGQSESLQMEWSDEDRECQIDDSKMYKNAEWMLIEVSWNPLALSMACLSLPFPRQEDGHLWGLDCLCQKPGCPQLAPWT